MNRSIAFLGESGDESGKISLGASQLFMVGLVVFPDGRGAERCGQRIDELRGELSLPDTFAFHFRDNHHAVQSSPEAASAGILPALRATKRSALGRICATPSSRPSA